MGAGRKSAPFFLGAAGAFPVSGEAGREHGPDEVAGGPPGDPVNGGHGLGVDMGSGVALKTPDEAKEDPAVLIDGHHEIHLDELVRQYLVTWAPMHPLCREDCAGLCPACGRNRNLGPCGCQEHGADPRWAALAELRDQL